MPKRYMISNSHSFFTFTTLESFIAANDDDDAEAKEKIVNFD